MITVKGNDIGKKSWNLGEQSGSPGTLPVSQNTSDKLSEELDKQSVELYQLHQYSRRNCIILSGIPVKGNETCEEMKHSFQKNVIKDTGENSK